MKLTAEVLERLLERSRQDDGVLFVSDDEGGSPNYQGNLLEDLCLMALSSLKAPEDGEQGTLLEAWKRKCRAEHSLRMTLDSVLASVREGDEIGEKMMSESLWAQLSELKAAHLGRTEHALEKAQADLSAHALALAAGREAVKNLIDGNDLALERGQLNISWADSAFRKQAVTFLATPLPVYASAAGLWEAQARELMLAVPTKYKMAVVDAFSHTSPTANKRGGDILDDYDKKIIDLFAQPASAFVGRAAKERLAGSLAMAHYYHADNGTEEWMLDQAERAQRPEHVAYADKLLALKRAEG